MLQGSSSSMTPPAAAAEAEAPVEQTALCIAEIVCRGRGLVASRPIKAGEVLLSDSPLVLYPADAATAAAYCSHCFRSLNFAGSSVPCPECSAAVFCSPLCLFSAAASPSHSPWLCSALARLRSLATSAAAGDAVSDARFILIAHALSPPHFHRLMTLASGLIAGAADVPSLSHLLSSLALPPPPSGSPLADPSLISSLLAIDKFNSFGLMEPFVETTSDRRVRAYGIYPNASFFNHDCLPNACRFEYVDTGINDGSRRNVDMAVRALHDIPQGQEVCLSYFPINWAHKDRQARLREDYLFECVCDRCEVEKNWKENKDDRNGEDNGMDSDGMEEDDGLGVEEAESDGDFPHAYFFIKFLCDREDCGGTMAPLPPSCPGVPTDVLECNSCGQMRKEEDLGTDVGKEDVDSDMLDG